MDNWQDHFDGGEDGFWEYNNQVKTVASEIIRIWSVTDGNFREGRAQYLELKRSVPPDLWRSGLELANRYKKEGMTGLRL